MANPGAADAKPPECQASVDGPGSVDSQRTDADAAGSIKKLGRIASGLFRRPRLWIGSLLLLGLIAGGVALASPYLKAWYYFRAARNDLQNYHNPQAVRHLHECLRVWPNDPDVLFLTARAARRARAYEEAQNALEKYEKVRGLDEACSLEQLLLAAERNVDQVASVCRRHVEQNYPDKALILEALSRGYLRQYRLSEARYCLDLWLKEQPDNPQALCLEGEFHLDYEHSPDRALGSYRRAVDLDSEHEEARQGLAIALLESKTYAEAVEQIEYLRKCQPDNLRIQVGLAECRHALGEREEAERLVDAVLAQEPDNAPALSLRGQLFLEIGRYADAEPWLRRAVARAPGDHKARYGLVLCLHQTGKEDEATSHEQDLKQWEDGLKEFNEIVTREMPKRPHDPDLYFKLGRLLLRSGHPEEGLRWLDNALALDPGHQPSRQALAEYARKAREKRGEP